MAFEENAVFETKIASSNVTALSYTSSDGSTIVYSSGGIPQYYVVAEDLAATSIGNVILSGAASKALGIAQDAPAVTAGQPVRVCVRGVCKAYAGAAIAYGDSVTANAAGQVITAPTATEYILGRAREAAVQLGDLISVDVNPSHGKVVYP